jgi:Nucleotidyl transferase
MSQTRCRDGGRIRSSADFGGGSGIQSGTRVVPVILAGGSGSRLWPMSREQYPNFVDTFGLGAGLGSARASRIAVTIGNLGMPGFKLFGAFVWRSNWQPRMRVIVMENRQSLKR